MALQATRVWESVVRNQCWGGTSNERPAFGFEPEVRCIGGLDFGCTSSERSQPAQNDTAYGRPVRRTTPDASTCCSWPTNTRSSSLADGRSLMLPGKNNSIKSNTSYSTWGPAMMQMLWGLTEDFTNVQTELLSSSRWSLQKNPEPSYTVFIAPTGIGKHSHHFLTDVHSMMANFGRGEEVASRAGTVAELPAALWSF